jgi:hypothetical protein
MREQESRQALTPEGLQIVATVSLQEALNAIFGLRSTDAERETQPI